MKISELFARQGSVEVEGIIKEVGEVRTFDKFGRQLRVADAILEDDSGTIKLTLWNDDIDNYKAGDKIKIINGYVSEFQGEKQLTSGKFGKIEKIGKGENITENIEETEEAVEESRAQESGEAEEGGEKLEEEEGEAETEGEAEKEEVEE